MSAYTLRRAGTPLLLGLATLLAACGGDRSAPASAADTASAGPNASATSADSASTQPLTLRGIGLASPETALWDSVADVYLVSNVSGKPGAADGNGFIARIRPDGTVDSLKWISGGTPGVTLNGPKGMLFKGDTLFAADVGGVRRFDRRTGKPLGSVPIESSGLNDLALGADGTLYVSDLGGNAIYRVTASGAMPVVKGSELNQPDGLLFMDGKLLVAPFGGSKQLYYVTPTGQRTPGPTMPGGTMDGLATLPDGGTAVTSWDAKAVYRLGADGQVTPLFQGLESPAQIGVDRSRNRLLVPLFNANELVIEPLPGAGPS